MIDLHLHLDGSLTPETVLQLAARQGLALPCKTAERLLPLLAAPESCGSLERYLRCFALPLLVLQTPQAVKTAVEALCGALEREGLLYAEIRFAPAQHTKNGARQEAVVEAALDGLRCSGFFGRLILCCMRGEGNEAANRETLRLAEKYLGKGVAAADLAGAEARYPTQSYAPLFGEACRLGVPVTIHAGEAAGAESVRAALSLGARRIGHGVRAASDPALMEELARRQIPLELCFSSNLQTKAVASPLEFPLRSFLKAGVLVTVNTDNRTVSQTTLSREYALLRDAFALTGGELQALRENSAKAAFLSWEEQKRLLEKTRMETPEAALF